MTKRQIDPRTGRRLELVIESVIIGGGAVYLPMPIPARGLLFFGVWFVALLFLFAPPVAFVAAFAIAWAGVCLTRPPVEVPPASLPDLREASQ